MENAILISVDGMRPNDFLLGSYTLEGCTVYAASEREGKSVTQ